MKTKTLFLILSLLWLTQLAFAQGIINSGAIISPSGTGSYWKLYGGAFTLTSRTADRTTFDNLAIASGASLNIDSRSFATVTGALTNNAGTFGLVMKSDVNGTGSLLHNTTDVDATIERYITGTSGSTTSMVYHLVSVPLTGNQLTGVFLHSYLSTYEESTGNWIAWNTPTTNPLPCGQGYLIYYTQPSVTYTMSGKLNNGAYTPTPLTYTDATHGYNLVPNPYPSAIDWDVATGSGWTKTNIYNAIYIWNSALSTSNYGSYVDGVSTNGVSNIIPEGQAFFVCASAATPVLSMDNRVRKHDNSRTFMKSGDAVPNVLHLSAAANGVTDEIAIRFSPEATTGFDGEYDASKMAGFPDKPMLSAMPAENLWLSICSLPTSSDATVVPLQFTMDTTLPVTLTASGFETFDPAVSIKLEDVSMNITTDLRLMPSYTFYHAVTDLPGRFKLHFGGITGIQDQPVTVPTEVHVNGNDIFIKYDATTARYQGSVYDIQGRMLRSFALSGAGYDRFTLNAGPGIYFVRLNLPSGANTTKIVIL